MPENRTEQLTRLRLMAAGDPTWDLSDNDIAALNTLIAGVSPSFLLAARLEPQLLALEVILGQITQLGNTAVDPGDYARAVGEARAKAEMALTRLRIIRSLLE